MKRLLLVVSVLFLLLPGQQVAASPTRDKGASEHGAKVETLTGAASPGLPLLHRVARMTPFWRSLSYKPSHAHCLWDLECISQYCRNGFCSKPHLES
ncbi:liver-expressed antimicrobial peptide 2-like [Sarcophilus harrisii]|uniref:liver-expressed antimicrobial peptide 2-like n=1 Tax=Sarcophilus harrisii TaxID=9305 RepID=UPI000226F179|nr:liver-expressed antimicrobial peptide 2-like [Sarcophilus harrisii]